MKMYTRLMTTVLVILACLCLAMPVFAESEKVAKIEGGAEYGSVQEAIDAAEIDGDTIILLNNTAENIKVSGKKITLDLGGFTLTSLPEAGKEAETTFFSVTGEADVTVKNGTLAGAVDADGKPVQVAHAVYVEGATFTLDHATISGHSVATSGGGIYADKAVINVQNGAVITGNTANGTTAAKNGTVGDGGGGIYACNGAAVTIDAGIISKNDAVKSGGGLLLNGSMLTTKNGSQINENKAHATEKYNGGGGIYSVNKSTIAIVDSQINKNISGARGGGVAVYNGNKFGNAEKPLDIQKSTIDGNIAAGTNAWGGGICYESSVTSIEYINIQDCTFCGNASSANGAVSVMGGGPAAVSNFHITIQDSDFCNNTIEANAGGPLTISYSNHLTVKECAFKENQGGVCGVADLLYTNGFVFDDLVIENNEAQFSGALRFMMNCSGMISGSKFIGNKSVSADNDNSAGCVYQSVKTTVNYIGCTFSGNSSKAGAGAVLIRETGFDGASAVFEGSVITNNSGALVGGIYFDTWFNARLIVKADSNGNGAVYGNTTTGGGSGNDFYISKRAASTTSTTIDLMPASSMKDGEKTLENYSYYSGADTYDLLTNAICKDDPSSFYSVQYCPETNVVKNVSENCAFNEKKYTLLVDAVGEVEAEETVDATHVLQLIAGENPGESKVIRQQATIRKDMEIQLNGRTIKPSAGTALVVEKNAHLILSGSGEVDTFGEGSAALAVNGTCSVTGAATIPSIRLGNGKSVAVTADARINKVYLDASVLKSLNLSAADMSVVLFTPYDGADISSLLPSVKVQGINKLVTVGMDDDGNIVASCKKMVGVFVDGISGNDNKNGLTPTTPVKTFTKAKEILGNNPDIGGIYVLNTVPVYDKQDWDLDGKWFKRYPTNVNSLISVGALAELTLKNIVVDGASDMVNADSAMVRVSRNGVLNITDGAELCNNSRDSSDPQRYLEHGGAVHSEGVVNMSGGSIHHNNADNGGGIFMYDEYAKLNLSGGVIEYNTVNESMPSSYGPSGGGVCLGWGADMEMTGGLVSCNTARYGGGIAVGAAYDDPDSVLKMTGGIVKGNSADLHGGGIFVQTNCKAYISAGQIIGNVAAPGLIGHFAGGGIYVNGNYSSISEYNYGELHLTDALIYENAAGVNENNYGGGGIGGCESSHTLIYNTHGAAIYDNDGMDLALNKSAWGMVGDPRPVGDIAEYMLGGGAYNWTDKNGVQFDSNKLDAFEYFEAAKSNPTDAAIATAKQLGTVVITGNSTGGNGGGIGSNGTVIIGVEEDVVDLSVTKLWNDLDNEEQLIEKDGKYYLHPEEGAEIVHPESFRVWLLRDGERVSVVEFKAESGMDEDGKAYLTWPKKLTFNDLPVGDHEYAIEEEMPQDALYACAVSGTAEDGFVVTNHYNPTCSITFEGEKTIAGREMNENDRFAFEIVEMVEGEEVFVASASSDGTGKISFPELTYQVTDVGEHEYIVRETGEAGKGIALDSKTYTVIVTVENNGDGTLSVSAPENAFALNFVNIYSVQPVKARIPVKKEVKAEEGMTPADLTGKFTFTLEAVTKDAPMPKTTSCTNPNKDGGTVTFGEIEFTKPGEYKYTITENGAADGVTNDTESSKTVTVTVVDNGDGTLTATADSTTDKPLTFTNEYSVQPVKASVPVQKVLDVPEGLTPADMTGKFTFTLEAVTKDAPMPKTTSYANPDKDGGMVTFGEIEYTKPGDYEYTIIETGSADGVTNDKDAVKTVTIVVVDNGKGELVIDAEKSSYTDTVFTNTYGVQPVKASIPVQKEVKAEEGLTPADLTGKFTFTLEAVTKDAPMPKTTSYANPDKDGGMVTFGEIEFTKPGTYEYTITESGSADGVTNDPNAVKTVTIVIADNGDGTLTATADSTTDAPLTFTNEYSVQPVKASIPVKKEVKAEEGLTPADLTGKFTFTLTAEKGIPMPKTTSYTNPDKDGGVVTFGEIEFTKPGEYKYTITESGSADGVTNDTESSKTVTVTVKDNGDGTLTATASSTADKPLTFTNTYGVEPTTASFPVEKVLTVPDGLTPADLTGKFTFTLEAVTKDAPIPEMTSYTNPDANGGVVTFGEIEFTKPGTYEYTITESGSADGVTNDKDAVKTVTIVVVDNGKGELVIDAEKSSYTGTVFTNTYGVESAAVVIQASKALMGRALNAGEFSFELKNAAGKTLQTVVNTADGNVIFDAISYTAPGVHAYTIHEVSGDLGGVTYDSGKVEVTVTVIDNGDGTLTATAAYGDKKQFENSYATNDKLVLNGIKRFTGREFRADDVFEMELLQNGTVIQRCVVSAVNGNTAAFSFAPITYTNAEIGTYQYTVREKAGSIKGVTYDAAQYTVEVTVSDDGKGDLIVDAVYTANGKAAESILFTNTYEAKGELALTAEKTVNGKEPTDDQVFDFTLSDVNGEIETVQNKQGEIEFTKLSYTLDDLGEHTYTVKENKNDKAGYAIDETVYTVKVTVTDNGDGTLKVEKKITANGKPAQSMTFDNKHSATLTISKKVEGCTTEETFPIKVWLFDAKGNELKGEYAYTGDVTGKLTSGVTVELGHDQTIAIEKLPVGSRYKVEETKDPRFTTMVNSLVMNTAEGEIVNGGNMAAFVNRLITTMFKVRKEWQGGDGGSIILTLYANGEKLEDQPAYTQEGDTYYYTGLPMYDEDGDEIIYSAKEKYVDGYLTIYKNVAPYTDETKAIYNGGTIINKAITTIKVQKVWSGLDEGAEVPEITLILHCNGEVYDRKTPKPDSDGWYVYSNLPSFVNGVRSVYSVTEEPMEGCSTIYTNNGEVGDCAYNGGTITNVMVPKTGDETPVALWMTGLLLSVAAIVLIGKKKTKA